MRRKRNSNAVPVPPPTVQASAMKASTTPFYERDVLISGNEIDGYIAKIARGLYTSLEGAPTERYFEYPYETVESDYRVSPRRKTVPAANPVAALAAALEAQALERERVETAINVVIPHGSSFNPPPMTKRKI